MPIPISITDLQTSDALNYPKGTDQVGGSIDDYFRAHAGIIRRMFSKGASVASATTLALPAEYSLITVTGTTTIAGIADSFPGRVVLLQFSDAVTLTHSATLKVPTGGNETTVAGDVLCAVNTASGVWEIVSWPALAARKTVRIAGDTMTGDLTVPSINGGQLAGHRNKVINGAFGINQRGYASGAATTVGQYTLDRWKVTGTGGITFSTAGGKTTVTIPSGQTLQQVIEAVNLPAGTYVLSWEGTAQGRIDGGAYGASGAVTVTLAGGVNSTVEFNAGTLANVQLEPGTVATPFEHRLSPAELRFCRRYHKPLGSVTARNRVAVGQGVSQTALFVIQFDPMRAAPSIGGVVGSTLVVGGSGALITSMQDIIATTTNIQFRADSTSMPSSTGQAVILESRPDIGIPPVSLDAEL